MRGTIYLLSNPAMPGLYKIGKTAGSAQDRARNLSTCSNMPMPFTVEFACTVLDMDVAEKFFHKLLAKRRVNMGREFFKINPQRVIEVMKMWRHVPPNPFLTPLWFANEERDLEKELIDARKAWAKFLRDPDIDWSKQPTIPEPQQKVDELLVEIERQSQS